ncbi:MAG: hypothetical protein R6T96_10450, partial [Longimicrobiales bacterium]
ISPASSGKHYLRYDVEYSLTNELNDSGTVLGVYFTGDSGAKAAYPERVRHTGNSATHPEPDLRIHRL